MFSGGVSRLQWQDLPKPRIFPSALRNPQNTLINMKSGPVDSNKLEESWDLDKIFDFDLFAQDDNREDSRYQESTPKWGSIAKFPKAKEMFNKRRPFNYRSPEMIEANIERYTTNFTNPEGASSIKVSLSQHEHSQNPSLTRA